MRPEQKIFLNVTAIIFGCFLLFSPAAAADGDQYGFHETARRTPIFSLSLSQSTPEALAESIVRLGLFFVGTIFFVLFIYGGFMWLTARGAPERVNTAKQILEAAIIGIILVVASYAIATYVFSQLTAAPATPAAETAGE